LVVAEEVEEEEEEEEEVVEEVEERLRPLPAPNAAVNFTRPQRPPSAGASLQA
jgi:hypothetical protein